MSITVDVASQVTGTGTGDLSWTHGGGSPSAALIGIAHVGDATQITSVEYGGVAASLLGEIAKAGGESAAVCMYLVPSGCPSGSQTIDVVVSGGFTKKAWCISLNASADLELVDDATISSNSLADPSGSLSVGGRSCLTAMVLMSGQDTLGGITALSGWAGAEVDFGTRTGAFYYRTTIDTSDPTYGWTQTAEDATAYVAAVAEVVSGPTLSDGGASYSYSATGAAAVRVTLSDGGASYSYSAAGAAAVRIVLTAGGASYSYSAAGVSQVRVTLSDGGASYSYSATGNVTVGTGAPDRTLSDGGASYSYSAAGAATVRVTLTAGGASYSYSAAGAATVRVTLTAGGASYSYSAAGASQVRITLADGGASYGYSAAGASQVRVTLTAGGAAYTYVGAGEVLIVSTRVLSDGGAAYTYAAAGELRGPGTAAIGGGKPRRVLLAEWLAREALERKLRKRRGQAPRRRPVPVELLEGEPLELIVWADETALPVAVPPALTAQLARALEAMTPEQLVYRRLQGRAQLRYTVEGSLRGPAGLRMDDVEDLSEITLMLSLLGDA